MYNVDQLRLNLHLARVVKEVHLGTVVMGHKAAVIEEFDLARLEVFDVGLRDLDESPIGHVVAHAKVDCKVFYDFVEQADSKPDGLFVLVTSEANAQRVRCLLSTCLQGFRQFKLGHVPDLKVSVL